MAEINDLATSIGKMEGWGIPGSIATRNNNPGNLRYAGNQIGSENTVNGKFATFATPEDGWLALQEYITTKANQGKTLRDFIYTYAPPSENNTSNYLNVVSSQLGIGADSSLQELLNGTSTDSNGGSSVDSSSEFSDLLSSSGVQQLDPWLVGLGVVVVVGLLVSRR